MANVFDLSKYIMEKLGRSITTMKLQKLCYYSFVWHLVWKDEPLFESPIYAWINGPVITDLFQKHKGLYQLSPEEAVTLFTDFLSPEGLTEDEKESIDKVLEDYGDKTGAELSDSTHSELPWIKAREGYNQTDRGNALITTDDIYNYYISLDEQGIDALNGEK